MRIWNRASIVAISLTTALVALVGCSKQEPSLLQPTGTSPMFTEASIPFELAFVSRTYAEGKTTFTYQLQDATAPCNECPGPVIAYITDITLEIPDCADPLLTYGPEGADVGIMPYGFDGIHWGVGYDDNPDFTYTLTFDGDIPAGVVTSVISSHGSVKTQTIDGPCGGYEISGNVFTDTNQNNLQSVSEFGIAGVTVKITDGETTSETTSDADGHYSFIKGAGTYTVSIESSTAAVDFNESLAASFDPTGPTSIEVTVGPDAEFKSFGFEPDVTSIIAQIDSGDLPTTGKSYKWWRRELLYAIKHNGDPAYTSAQLLDFIHQIEDLAILDEYNFTPGNELQEAFDILDNHFIGDEDGSSIGKGGKYDQGTHDAYAALLRELLTFEFNHVSGRGLSDFTLQGFLINWGEGLLSNNAPNLEIYVLPGDGGENLLETPLEGGTTLFRKGNTATGGGGTN